MADLLGVMDVLWFHQKILFSDTVSPLSANPTITPQTIEDALQNTASDHSLSPSMDDDISTASSSNITLRDDHELDNTDEEIEEPNYKWKRASRSHSFSPSMQKYPRNIRNAWRKLQKTTSCKSLSELEFEEVKGFMDLGFSFNKEELNPRMMSMIPGLQRIGEYEQNVRMNEIDYSGKMDEIGARKPYLSEAWLIKRPDSPLLNLRMPPVSATVDMKKHIRFWARTVALVVQDEC